MFKRHDEYRAIFKKFFEYVVADDDPNSVIFLGGDIVHSKTAMTPELVRLVSEFFKGCADLRPTILILGNHDLNLKNPSRLDSLSPIVESLNHPNLYFWRETGVYHFDDVAFSVMSVLGNVADWITADKIESAYKIALHHGAVHGSNTDLGYKINNITVQADKFDGFDLVLLGDIHQMQYLNTKKTIAYPSSLIQQNHGEGLHAHGFLEWDLASKKSKFVKLQNRYGYYTFEFDGGKWINPTPLPEIIRARVKYKNTPKEDLIKFFKGIGSNHSFQEIVYHRDDPVARLHFTSDVLLTNFYDIEKQNELICDFVADVLGLKSDSILDSIRHINRQVNSEMRSTQVGLRGVTWNLKKFSFSNMFSYGENNEVFFDEINGVCGIFAPNASGKSTLLYAISFCLFDKCPVGSKGVHVLNTLKDEFICECELLLGGEIYKIRRVGYRNTKNPDSVKVDVEFWKEIEGNQISLTGENRDDTNRIIREYLGTYDDFVMTSLSSQTDNQSFIDKTQKERKELLYRFLDLSIFDQLWKIAKEKHRELSAKIKGISETEMHDEISRFTSEVKNYAELIEKYNSDIEFALSNVHNLYERNKEILPQIRNLDITDSEESLVNKVERIKSEIESTTRMRIEAKEKANQIADSLTPPDILDFDVSILDYLNTLTDDIRKTSILKSGIEAEILHLSAKIEQLANHEYDPKCKFCTQNQFVVDAETAKTILPTKIEENKKLELHLVQMEEQKHILMERRARYDKYMAEMREYERGMREIDLIQQNLKSSKSKIEYLRDSLQQTELLLQKAIANRIAIIRNRDLQMEVQENESQITAFKKLEMQSRSYLSSAISNLATAKISKSVIEAKFDEYKNNSAELIALDAYLKSVSKDGVPYKIMSLVLPLIEFQVNEILQNIVGFNIKLETSDDKYIYGYIEYGENKKWPIEITSGMERFILSQAIRLTLTHISNLPKPNFIAIDEGFGVLDSENLNSVHRLFDSFQEKVDFVLCITHIEQMKDIADSTLEITKENDFSRIYG